MRRLAIVRGEAAGVALPGGTRDVIYHVDWERTPLASPPAQRPPLPLEQLQAAASKALEQVIAIRGRQELQAAMAAGDDLAASPMVCAKWG